MISLALSTANDLNPQQPTLYKDVIIHPNHPFGLQFWKIVLLQIKHRDPSQQSLVRKMIMMMMMMTYMIDKDGNIRKQMELEGCGRMSIKEWMDSWRPSLNSKKGSVSNKGKVVAKGTVAVTEVEVSSADDDSRGIKHGVRVRENVKAGNGSSTPTSVSSSVITVESKVSQLDFWRFRYKMLDTKMKELEAKNVELKRKPGRNRCSSKKIFGATDRQLLDEAKQGMREVSRHVKFQKPGWLSFSRQKGTVCQMVRELMNIWYNVLVPHLPGVLQDLKNKMTQKFRGQHEKDYGTPKNYVSGDDLVDVIRSCDL
eukprot:scaffold65811_cov43-Cyclotella_meneghiniana.AAC.2